MAQIPLGNFDEPNVLPQTNVSRVDTSGSTRAGEAIQRAGDNLVNEAGRWMQEHEQRKAKEKQERDGLTRAKTANALTQHELQVRAAAAEVQEQVATGAIDYEKAEEAYDAAASQLTAPQIDGQEPALAETYMGGIKNNTLAGKLQINGAVKQARRDDYKSQFAQILDAKGKLAGMPGADIGKIVEDVRAFIPIGRQAGLDQAVLDKAVQDFSDKAWTNHALQRYNGANDSVEQLRALEQDLTDEKGAYIDKLDADKRTAVALQVGNRIDSLEAKAEHKADRADAIATRTLEAIDAQAATGIPATAEQRAAWADVFKDSPRKAEYVERIRGEQEVQAFLRLPIEQQQAKLQAEQAKMMAEGGDKHDQANFAKKKAAAEAGIKLLTEQPLLFAQYRMATPVVPLDIAALGDPGRAGELAGQLERRAATVAALQKKYGPQVQNNVLLPQEVTGLAGGLDKMPVEKRVEAFGTLRKLVGDDATYDAIMQQLAPDSPVTARAGELAAAQRRYTTDKRAVSPNVALTLLKGEALLNKTKGDKALDGKASPFPMPSDDKLRTTFQAQVGSAFAADPDTYERRFQEMRAYYAGRSAESGAISDEINERLVQEAVIATAGRMVPFRNRTVAAPWGMTAGDFEDAAGVAMRLAVSKLPEVQQRNVVDNAALTQVGNGVYLMIIGRNVVYGADGKPIVVRVRR